MTPSERAKSIGKTLGHLKQIGCEGIDERKIQRALEEEPLWYIFNHELQMERDRLFLKIKIEAANDSSDYEISTVDARLKPYVFFGDDIVNEVNVGALDREMEAIDWSIDYKSQGLQALRPDMPSVSGHEGEVEALLAQVDKAGETVMGSPIIADLLNWKHMVDTPNEFYLRNVDRLKEKFEFSHQFDMRRSGPSNATEMYRLLLGRSVEKKIEKGEFYNGPETGYMQLQQEPGRSTLHWHMGITREELGSILTQSRSLGLGHPGKFALFVSMLAAGGCIPLSFDQNLRDGDLALAWFDAEAKVLKYGNNAMMEKYPLKVSNFHRGLYSMESVGFYNYEAHLLRATALGADFFDAIMHRQIREGDTATVRVCMAYYGETQGYLNTAISGTLNKSTKTPQKEFDDSYSLGLEEKMKTIDWAKRDWWQFGRPVLVKNGAGENLAEAEMQKAATWVFAELNTYYHAGDGYISSIADGLVMKYLRGTPNEHFIENLPDLKRRFERGVATGGLAGPYLRADDVIELLDGRTVPINVGDEKTVYATIKNGMYEELSYSSAHTFMAEGFVNIPEPDEDEREKRTQGRLF